MYSTRRSPPYPPVIPWSGVPSDRWGLVNQVTVAAEHIREEDGYPLTGRKDHCFATGVELKLHAFVLSPVSGNLDRNLPPVVRPGRAKRLSLCGGVEGLFHRFLERGF